jgi:phage-related minor tail protein
MAGGKPIRIAIVAEAKKAIQGVNEVGTALGGLAKVGAAAGAAAGLAIGTGVVGAMDVQKANSKLAAQLDLTKAESKRIGQVAGDLYKNAYGDSIEGVNDAVGAVMSSIKGMSNASSRDLKAVTAQALDFAAAFEVDVSRAAQVAGTVVNQGLAKNGTQAFDLLTRAAQKVPAELRDGVLDAASEYSQFFDALGFQGPEAFGLLVKGAEKGEIGLDKMGDAIKEFTIRASDGSTASQDAFKAIGLDADTMANKFLKGGKTSQKAFKQTINGLLGIKDPAKQSQAAIALFGTPLEDLNTAEIPEFLKSLTQGQKAMEGWNGSTKRMGKTLNDNASTNIESFKRQAQTAFVNIVGGKVLPIVTKVSGVLARNFGPALKSTAEFLSQHRDIIVPVAVALGTMAGVIGTVVAAVRVWTAVQTVLNVVMAANPIGLIIIAVAGLVAGLTYFFTQTKTGQAIIQGAWSGIKTAISAVTDWWSGTALPIIKGTWTSITEAFRVGKEKIGSFLTGALNVIKTVWKYSPLGLIITNWSKIIEYFRSIPGKVRGFFTAAINFVKAIWKYTPIGLITSNWGRIMAYFRAIPGKIKGVFSSAIDWLKSAGTWILNGLKNGLTNAWGNVSYFMRNIPSRIKAALGDTGGMLLGAGRAIIDGFLGGLKAAYGKVQDFVGGIASWIKNNKGPISYDRVLLTPAGKAIMDGLRKGLEREMPKLKRTLGVITDTIQGLSAAPEVRVTAAADGPLSRNLATASVAPVPAGAGAGAGQALNVTVSFESTGDPLIDTLVDMLRKRVRVNGGDVQRVLGAGRR